MTHYPDAFGVGTQPKEPYTGVCHLTATAVNGDDPSWLRVRLVMTVDVASPELTTRYAIGADATCQELKGWIRHLCERAARPTPPDNT